MSSPGQIHPEHELPCRRRDARERFGSEQLDDLRQGNGSQEGGRGPAKKLDKHQKIASQRRAAHDVRGWGDVDAVLVKTGSVREFHCRSMF
jgi:hypothetical protein